MLCLELYIAAMRASWDARHAMAVGTVGIDSSAGDECVLTVVVASLQWDHA